MAYKMTLILALLSLALSGHSMPNPTDALAPRAPRTATVDVYTLATCATDQVGGSQEYTVTEGVCAALKPIPSVPETGFLSYRVAARARSCEFQVFTKADCTGDASEETPVNQEKTCRNVPPSFQGGSTTPVGVQVGGFSGKLLCD